jgi:hypothetical protein
LAKLSIDGLGAGVWEGVVEADARGKERVRRVRRVEIILERFVWGRFSWGSLRLVFGRVMGVYVFKDAGDLSAGS